MSEVTSLIYSYIEENFIEIRHKDTDLCEDVCNLLCKKYGFVPLVQLLLGLRVHDKKYYLSGCRPLNPNDKYEFRVRFKIPKLSSFKIMDKKLFNYYYCQLRYDLLQSKINEIEYPKHKNKILGYVVSDMYRKMLEDGCEVGELEKDYKKYIPRKINERHSILFINYARSKVFSLLNRIRNHDHDVDYVKSVYIDDIDNTAPGYLYEEYSVTIAYPDQEDKGKCRVKIKFVPFDDASIRTAKTDKEDSNEKDELSTDEKMPGLKVYYSHKWMHIAKIEEIFTVFKEKDTNIIKLSIKDQPNHYMIEFQNELDLESFVSCLSGYYRLMCKWTQNLCKDFQSPSLIRLLGLKCHGPIGGKFSYNKIKEKKSSFGAHIVRQSEFAYDAYFVDILNNENVLSTYKVTYKDSIWNMHDEDNTIKESNSDLVELVKNIDPNISRPYRISPSEYDKPPNLLLCVPSHQQTSKKKVSDVTEMKQVKPQIINASTELVINRKLLDSFDEFFEQRAAIFHTTSDTKINVTLKMLKMEKKDKNLCEFLQLADFWACLDSIDILKLYGITLYKPISMVFEAAIYGSLDEFLRRNDIVKLYCLIDAAHSLARAIYYLQEKKLVHGRIRCSAMQVCQFEKDKNLLIVKLGDAGFQRMYSEADIPWIPTEYHDLQHNSEHIKNDPKADIWACTTTFWEIFSRGKKCKVNNARQFFIENRLRVPPEVCKIDDIREIMYKGWSKDPDKRFSPQESLATFMSAKQEYSVSYNYVGNNNSSTVGSGSKNSLFSNQTENTFINSRGDLTSLVSSDCDQRSNSSNCSTLSDGSCTRSSAPLLNYNGSDSQTSGSTLQGSLYMEDEYDDLGEGYIDMPDGKIIFNGRIGEGHFGTVYKGSYDRWNESIEDVALKTIKSSSNVLATKEAVKDFKREITIMKDLNHPNIVKIIDYIDEPHKLIIIMEYLQLGSLLDYLKYTRTEIDMKSLLKFSQNIAGGMAYLAEKKIIHRDLAARNILVESKESVKISDFGLAQFTNSGNYYIAQSKRDLPLKWYAPETLATHKYSTKSDVWSYGVTLFEMFSYGEPPYNGIEFHQGAELYNRLENGERLPKPRDCDKLVYDQLMLPCWEFNQHLRPTFQTLLDTVDGLIDHFAYA